MRDPGESEYTSPIFLRTQAGGDNMNDCIVAKCTGNEVVFVPDLTLWYRENRSCENLPEEWKGAFLAKIDPSCILEI